MLPGFTEVLDQVVFVEKVGESIQMQQYVRRTVVDQVLPLNEILRDVCMRFHHISLVSNITGRPTPAAGLYLPRQRELTGQGELA